MDSMIYNPLEEFDGKFKDLHLENTKKQPDKQGAFPRHFRIAHTVRHRNRARVHRKRHRQKQNFPIFHGFTLRLL